MCTGKTQVKKYNVIKVSNAVMSLLHAAYQYRIFALNFKNNSIFRN